MAPGRRDGEAATYLDLMLTHWEAPPRRRPLVEACRLVEDGREPFGLGGRERLVLRPKHLLHARREVAGVR